MSETRIVKVKVSKGNRIGVTFEVQKKNSDNWNRYSCSCFEAPKDSFNKAMHKLLWEALEIMEMSESYGNSMSVTGVSYSYNEDIMGAVMTLQKDLTTSTSPALFNTPHLPSVSYNGESADPVLSPVCIRKLEILGQEAIAYAQGQRKQMEMDLSADKDAKDDKERMDELTDQAWAIIKETQRASASSISRRLRIGFTRANRIIEIFEEQGKIGPPRGTEPREILVDISKETIVG